jgi:hypothetical protein
MFLILTLILIGIIIAKYIYDLHKFNYNGHIQQLQSLNSVVVQESLKHKGPLVIHNVRIPSEDLTHETLVSQNPGYIVQDQKKQVLLSTLTDKDVDHMVFYKNKILAQDTGIARELDQMTKPFDTKLSCGKTCSLSVLKGSTIIQLSQNTHDTLVLYQLQGHCTLYLINPKHAEDIVGPTKTAPQLKKWAHIVKVEPNLLISIPPNWFYFYESKGPMIQGVIESDTYPTWLYNYAR